MTRLHRLVVLPVGGAVLAALLGLSCGTDPENDQLEPGIPGQVVRTDQYATIEHPDGWEIHLPLGAVSPDKEGRTGEMLFSIEAEDMATLGLPAAAPSGWSLAGEPVSFGPEWFTLAAPATATIPLAPSVDLASLDACLFAFDRPASRWVARGGRVAAQARTLSADMVGLDPHVVMTRPISSTAWGAIAVDAIAGYQFILSVESVQLGYFSDEADFDAAWCHLRVPALDDPVTPSGGRLYLVVPQGIYHLAVGAYRATDPRASLPEYLGYGRTTVTVGSPHYDWIQPGHEDYTHAVALGDLSWWADPSHLTMAAQPNVPTATPSVGIGALNVRLEWAAAADLDLWVVDPCGNRVWGGAVEATCNDAIGLLDLDNQCSRLVPGKPENVFWPAPARGTYQVYADYYEDCGGTGRLYYTLRWLVGGAVHARHGWLLPPEWTGVVGDEVMLAEFTY
ncbi:MAG: hypothetical protein MUE60_01160 [Candidatus Eisenbacteria bacterium]|nr:hypothetical protein [Candidatus Eisenbacteria bacterium]